MASFRTFFGSPVAEPIVYQESVLLSSVGSLEVVERLSLKETVLLGGVAPVLTFGETLSLVEAITLIGVPSLSLIESVTLVTVEVPVSPVESFGGGGRYGTAEKSYNQLREYHKRWKKHVKRRVKKFSVKKLLELGRFPLIEELKQLSLDLDKDPIVGIEKLIAILPFPIVDRALTDITQELKEQQAEFEELSVPPKRFKLGDELADGDLNDPFSLHDDEIVFTEIDLPDPGEDEVSPRALLLDNIDEIKEKIRRELIKELMPILRTEIELEFALEKQPEIAEDELRLVIQELIT